MKKLFKRLISAVTALTFAISILPLSVNAATIDNATFTAKIAQLQTIFKDGEYWNAYNACGYEGTGPNRCPDCTNKGMTYCDGGCADNCGQFYLSDGRWISGQCLGFACKMGNAVFGGNPLAWSQHTNAANIKPGDIIYGNLSSILSGASMHAIFITAISGTSVTYADCNSGAPCRVNWGRTTTVSAIQTATNRGAKIYHASNNATTIGSLSPSINYSSITPGNYFIISQSDGKSLTLANNEDWNTNNVHMYETAWSNRGQHMEISQASDGYKIRPIDSTRLVNPYGDYAAEGQNINIYADVNDSSQWWKFEKSGDGYIIRNAQNPNLVIDNADSSEAKLWTFNNGSNQKWLLVPAAAPGAPAVKGVKSSYTQSEAIIADWDATYNTDRYDIGVAKYENGDYKWVFWQGNVTPEFNVSAAAELGAGEYRMRLESVNTKIPLGNGSAYLSTVGEYVYFDIKENAAAPESYTIAFNANGGSGTMPNVSMTVGVAKNLPANKFTRTGYTFLGWSTNKSAASPTYKDKQSVKDLAQSGTVTLYAVWQSSTTPTIRMNNATAAIGQQVSIPVYIDNAHVSSITYSVKFDPRVLKFVSASEIPFMMYDINSKDAASGSVTVACLEKENFATGGKIAVYTFEVLAKSSCSTSIQLSVSEAADVLEKPITFKSTEAKITIGSFKLGDVNGDGKVNLTDVRWILQSSSGSRAFTDAQRSAADVNKDGRVNLTDARWLLQVASGSRKL